MRWSVIRKHVTCPQPPAPAMCPDVSPARNRYRVICKSPKLLHTYKGTRREKPLPGYPQASEITPHLQRHAPQAVRNRTSICDAAFTLPLPFLSDHRNQMDRENAAYISSEVLRAQARLEETLRRLQYRVGVEGAARYRAALAIVFNAMNEQILNPIFCEHPSLEPTDEEATAVGEQAAAAMDAEGSSATLNKESST